MAVSPATQALIDAAEADIPITQGLLAKVSGDQTAVSGAQSTLTADQTALQAATAKQLADSIAALNALATELGVPPGTVLGSPPAGAAHMSNDPKARLFRAFLSNPRVATAHALSIPWQQIIAALLQGGLPALEALIQQILTGLGTGTTGS